VHKVNEIVGTMEFTGDMHISGNVAPGAILIVTRGNVRIDGSIGKGARLMIEGRLAVGYIGEDAYVRANCITYRSVARGALVDGFVILPLRTAYDEEFDRKVAALQQINGLYGGRMSHAERQARSAAQGLRQLKLS
jgi:hypothetical protein